MSKSDIARLDRQVKAVIDRLTKLKRQYCKACGKLQPHQEFDGASVCWRCGSY